MLQDLAFRYFRTLIFPTASLVTKSNSLSFSLSCALSRSRSLILSHSLSHTHELQCSNIRLCYITLWCCILLSGAFRGPRSFHCGRAQVFYRVPTSWLCVLIHFSFGARQMSLLFSCGTHIHLVL